jgi:hypothetical protein
MAMVWLGLMRFRRSAIRFIALSVLIFEAA